MSRRSLSLKLSTGRAVWMFGGLVNQRLSVHWAPSMTTDYPKNTSLLALSPSRHSLKLSFGSPTPDRADLWPSTIGLFDKQTDRSAGVISPACGDQCTISSAFNTPQDPPACTVHLEYYIRSGTLYDTRRIRPPFGLSTFKHHPNHVQ